MRRLQTVARVGWDAWVTLAGAVVLMWPAVAERYIMGVAICTAGLALGAAMVAMDVRGLDR